MVKLTLLSFFILAAALLAAFAAPAFAVVYNPGVTAGQYVKYGNFAGIGPGAEAFNDYDWLKLQATSITGKEVTLLSTSQFKNGTAVAGNGSVTVWNVETGTEDGVPSTQGPIIAANLNQGDAIPPPNTYTVNRTESRVYLGVSRTVNILDVSLSTPDYNTTLTYVYDQTSGMLLQSTTQTITHAQPQPVESTISYSIIETNIFGTTQQTPTPTSTAPTPSPTIPEFPSHMAAVIILAILVLSVSSVILTRKKDLLKTSL